MNQLRLQGGTMDEVEKSDRLLSIEFWQRQSAEDRMAEAWRLSLIVYGLTSDSAELRMQKQIESFQRMPSPTSSESQEQEQ
jgi:hypothetical protein